MSPTFYNLYRCFRAHNERLEAHNIGEKELIIGYGNTGDGKTTLYLCILFGKDALELQVQE